MANYKSKKLNLYTSYKNKKQAKSSGRTKRNNSFAIKVTALSIVFAGAIGGLYVFTKINTDKMQNELDELISQTNDPDLMDTYYKSIELSAQQAQLVAQKTALQKQLVIFDNTQNQYVFLTSDMFTNIKTICENDISITSYSVEENVFTGSFSGTTAKSVSEFVIRLRDANIFTDIEYYGYGKGSDSHYIFELSCKF